MHGLDIDSGTRSSRSIDVVYVEFSGAEQRYNGGEVRASLWVEMQSLWTTDSTADEPVVKVLLVCH